MFQHLRGSNIVILQWCAVCLIPSMQMADAVMQDHKLIYHASAIAGGKL
jgi:hypothetical protein